MKQNLEIEIQSKQEFDKGILADKIIQFIKKELKDFKVIYVSEIKPQRIIEGL
jgi:hypothetical protein